MPASFRIANPPQVSTRFGILASLNKRQSPAAEATKKTVALAKRYQHMGGVMYCKLFFDHGPAAHLRALRALIRKFEKTPEEVCKDDLDSVHRVIF